STDSPDELQRELFRQLDRFRDLTGRLPTHIDSHHNAHRDPRALPHFLVLAREYHLPLREHSLVGYFSHFYGQWGGETHLEQVGVDALIGMLEKEIDDGFTELSCHPGYVDRDYATSYSVERETELRTLCDPRIRQCLVDQAIRLVNFQGKPRLL